MEKFLKRVSTNKIVAGVCSGLGKYFEIDPLIWRLIFILGALFSAGIPFILIYIVMWIVMPKEEINE
jgi:phage shock protein C